MKSFNNNTYVHYTINETKKNTGMPRGKESTSTNLPSVKGTKKEIVTDQYNDNEIKRIQSLSPSSLRKTVIIDYYTMKSVEVSRELISGITYFASS